MSWSELRAPLLAFAALFQCAPSNGQHPAASKPVVAPRAAAPIRSVRPSTDAGPPLPADRAPCAAISLRVEALPPSAVGKQDVAIADKGDRGLSAFHEKLAALSRAPKERLVRVAFYGDSNLTLDQLSGTLRRKLQGQFGDGGHGFVGVGSPWRGYRHQDVQRQMVGHWETYIFTRGAKPRVGGFGASGMSAATGEPGAKMKLGTAKAGASVGTKATQLIVFYARHAKGGRFRVRVDGAEVAMIETQSVVSESTHVAVPMEDAGHSISIENLDRKFVHLLGTVLERPHGLVVDTLAVTGATYGAIAKLDKESVRPMLAARHHDLVLFMLGTNFWNSAENLAGLDTMVARHRASNPSVSILIIGPPDHVRTKTSTQSDPRVVRVIDELRNAARERGLAYWDLRAAMGGDGSMRNFYYKGLAGKDLYHLTEKGAGMLGERLAHALLRSHAAYLERQPTAGCSVN